MASQDCWQTPDIRYSNRRGALNVSYGMPCLNRHIFSQFADFWMGWVFHAPWTMVDHETIPSDQLCSMVFTLSNMYMFVCVYVNGFHEDWANCRSQSNAWPVAFVLATLPFFIRLIQSIKRYVDSGLITHLINVCVLVSLIWHVNSTDVVN